MYIFSLILFVCFHIASKPLLELSSMFHSQWLRGVLPPYAHFFLLCNSTYHLDNLTEPPCQTDHVLPHTSGTVSILTGVCIFSAVRSVHYWILVLEWLLLLYWSSGKWACQPTVLISCFAVWAHMTENTFSPICTASRSHVEETTWPTISGLLPCWPHASWPHAWPRFQWPLALPCISTSVCALVCGPSLMWFQSTLILLLYSQLYHVQWVCFRVRAL